MMFKFFSIILIFLLCGSSYSQVKVTVDEKSNVLIVRAPKDQQSKIKKIIEAIDITSDNNIVRVVPLDYVYASDVVPVLTNVMRAFKPTMRSSISSNVFDPALNGIVMSDDRTNQLIIISDKSTIINIELIAKQLDKKIKLEDNILFKRLSNAKSSDIGIILNSISKR
jgi:type II secretory pathway component GspD/PulD (secretin)